MKADLIFTNGAVYTVDLGRSWATAVAIRDGKVIGVGTDLDMASLAGPATRVEDLKGHMMMPGIIDVHNHHNRGGQTDPRARCARCGIAEQSSHAPRRQPAQPLGQFAREPFAAQEK